jgi:hypothetical protein
MGRRLFEGFEKGFGRILFFLVKIFGRSLRRFWRAMKEKLWE